MPQPAGPRNLPLTLTVAGATAAWLLAMSCAPGEETPRDLVAPPVGSEGGDDAEQAAGAGATGGSSPDRPGPETASGALEPDPDGTAVDFIGDETEEDACIAQSVAATATPPVIQLVVDTSGSMNDRPGAGGAGSPSKWDITRQALFTAVEAMPEAIAVGVTYYPNGPAQGGACYFPDVGVPIAPLSAEQRQLIIASGTAVNPRGGTPTHGAYEFGLEQLRLSAIEGNKLMLLITDGIPTFPRDCSGNGQARVDASELIADVALATSDDIHTFVIGSPGSEAARDELSQMAFEGLTAPDGCSHTGPEYCHFDMTQEEDFATALNDALREITARALACDYEIPPAPFGLDLKLDAISVSLEAGDGTVLPLSRAAGVGCTGDWRVSDDGQTINICPDACDTVQNVLLDDPEAHIQVRFECTANPS